MMATYARGVWPAVRLLPILSAALLAMLLAATGLLLMRDRQAALDAVLTQQGNMVLGLERDIERNIEVYDLSLRAAASGYHLLDGSQNAELAAAILFDGASTARYFLPILIVNEAGTVLHDGAGYTPRFSSVAGRQYLSLHRGEAGLGLLVKLELSSLATNKAFLSLTRRLNDADGHFAGVVAGGVSIDYFQDVFSRFKLLEGSAIALVSYDGRLVAGVPFRNDKVGQDVSGGGLVEAAKSIVNGNLETRSVLDGVTRVATVRQLGSYPFFLVIGTPTGSVYAGWWVRAQIIVASVAAFIGTACLLLLALSRELRARRLAEEAALSSREAALAMEAKLECYIDNLADGILVAGRRPDGTFAYERMNGAAAQILGVRAEDVIGRHPREVWPAPIADFVEAKWQQSLTGQGPLQYQNVYETAGVRRVLRFNLAPVRAPSGEVVLLLNSIRDATAYADLEAQLRQSQRMEAVGQLTAGVAHDFNNMLQVQFGALELLLDEIADRPAAVEYAAVTLNASKHGSKLTHSLLAFSRQQYLSPQAVPVAKLFDLLAGMLSSTLGPRITLRFRAGDGIALPFADMAQLEAAMLNLALNARDAMPDGGTLTIEACDGEDAPDRPAGLDAGSHVLLAVSDEGPGMSEDVKARVCEPFFTTKGVGEGSGLGLSMVHGFVQQSGGSLRILSAPGDGTRVELWLPKAAAPELVIPEPPPPTRTWEGVRVLLVDDAAEVLAITAELLEGAGFDVVQATHGEEALLLLETEPPFDILVTDYVMPGIDGGELVKRCCAMVPGLPAIVITGFADADLLGKLPARAHVLRKPITGKALAQRIGETALGLERSAA